MLTQTFKCALYVGGRLIMVMLFSQANVIFAQEVQNPTPPSSIAETVARDAYRLGPGDVLDVRVFNRPQLSRDAVRIDARGMIRMPLLEEEIQAACRTESELAREIITRYLKFLRTPSVDVFIKEYSSQPVAVIGAVNQPGRFQLQRRVRLLELLTLAGGPKDNSGASIKILRSSDARLCDSVDAASTQTASISVKAEADSYVGNVADFNLNQLLQGDDQANPYVQPGDVVTLPEAAQVYVVGNVLRPTPISIKEPVTITRAIAIAGGTLPATKKDKVKIIRQAAGGGSKTELIVDLDAINKRRAVDVVLQANDIIDVPTSTGKTILRGLVNAIAPNTASLPLSVIR